MYIHKLSGRYGNTLSFIHRLLFLGTRYLGEGLCNKHLVLDPRIPLMSWLTWTWMVGHHQPLTNHQPISGYLGDNPGISWFTWTWTVGLRQPISG